MVNELLIIWGFGIIPAFVVATILNKYCVLEIEDIFMGIAIAIFWPLAGAVFGIIAFFRARLWKRLNNWWNIRHGTSST